MYTEQVMEHFYNPHNMGEIENADGAVNAGIHAYRGNHTPLLLVLSRDLFLCSRLHIITRIC